MGDASTEVRYAESIPEDCTQQSDRAVHLATSGAGKALTVGLRKLRQSGLYYASRQQPVGVRVTIAETHSVAVGDHMTYMSIRW